MAVILAAFPVAGAVKAPPAPAPPRAPQTAPVPQTAPAVEDAGTLILQLAGNRNFCVDRNEIDIKPGSVKPRQQRIAPLVTTMGYKYQISANRRGTTGIVKLLESPTIQTAYMMKEHKKQGPPQPRLATPKDLKNPTNPLAGAQKVPHWIAENTCTTLKPEYSFPLSEGHYDVYLGFDVLLNNGQWVPLQSDFLTDVAVQKGLVTRVDGRVDFEGGARTVKLESFEKPVPAETR
jgi:hypothetical protein